MVKTRNQRDRNRLALVQSQGHISTIEQNLLDVGSSLLDAVPTEERMLELVKLGYPENYREKLLAAVNTCDALLTGLTALREGIKSLHDIL